MATCVRCGSYATDTGTCSKLRCHLGVSPTARVFVREPDARSPYYRPDYAPVPRQVAPWWTIRESWVVIGATLAGIAVAGTIIWLVVSVGFVLTEH
jgi:hypothetical protein